MLLLQGTGQWVGRECYKNYQNHFWVIGNEENVSGYLINVGLNPKQARESVEENVACAAADNVEYGIGEERGRRGGQ
jgi:hypothetical protein